MNAVMQSSLPRHRVDVDQYHRMVEEGLLAPGARVELIDGEIIEMPPIGSTHNFVVMALAETFHGAVQGLAHVCTQGPLRLSRFSEIQPDIQLLAPPLDRYRARVPIPVDVLLAIEVGASTLRLDRDVKVPLYAQHGVPEVWLVDVDGRQILLYGSLKAGRYEDARVIVPPASLSPAALPQVSVDLSRLFEG